MPAPPLLPAEWGTRFFELLPDLLLVATVEGRVLRVNEAWTRQLGWPQEEVLAQGIELLHPEDRGLLAGLRGDLRGRGEVVGLELRVRTQDGRWRTLLVSARLAAEDGLVFAVGSDITARKQAEVLLEERSRQLSLSNAELERFASIVSHDLQAPVRKIMLFGDRLRSQFGEQLPPGARDSLQRIHAASERVHGLINDLLHYSRAASEPFQPTWVELDQVARTVLADLEETIAERHAEVQIDPLPRLESSRSLMTQLFQNLMTNALKFCAPGQRPWLHVSAEWDAQVARLHFQDRGIGLDERYAARIFGIFQRLHRPDEYPGSGVGLAICARIVERHGGVITVRSAPGQGARFTVVLPMQQPRAGE